MAPRWKTTALPFPGFPRKRCFFVGRALGICLLAAERNDAVTKYIKAVQEFKDLAQKWNDAQAAAATNAPPKK